jgi:hypothetical protein
MQSDPFERWSNIIQKIVVRLVPSIPYVAQLICQPFVVLKLNMVVGKNIRGHVGHLEWTDLHRKYFLNER